MDPRVCPVVVATTPGEGFEEGRWLAPWGDSTVLGHVLDEVRTWDLGDGILVLGDRAESILAEIDCSGFLVIIDPEWNEGVAASLRTAFDFLTRESDVTAALIVDASLPTIRRSVVDSLLEAAAVTDKPAIVPKYRYAAGYPILLQRWLWPQLVGVDRNATLAAALETHPPWVEEVWIDQIPPLAVDSPDALTSLAPRR